MIKRFLLLFVSAVLSRMYEEKPEECPECGGDWFDIGHEIYCEDCGYRLKEKVVDVVWEEF